MAISTATDDRLTKRKDLLDELLGLKDGSLMTRKALIVGGGIAGMSAAIALRRIGVDVDVVERNQANSVLGVGIYLPSPALRALHALELLEDVKREGTELEGLIFHDADGSNPRIIPALDCLGPGYPKLMAIPRPAYSRVLTNGALRAGAHIRYGTTVQALEQSDDGVEVAFSDGISASYDLVVGADGIRSSIRQMVFGDLGQPWFSGQAAWRYNLPRLPGLKHNLMFEGPEGVAGLVPLSEDTMYMLLTDPSNQMEPPTGALDLAFRQKLSPFGGVIGELRDTAITDPAEVVWKAFEMVDLPAPWHSGRVIIIGDAAHATTAHLGMGGAMAMEDAFVLGDELGTTPDIATAFARFMDRRFERVRLVSDTSYRISQAEVERRQKEAEHGELIAMVFQRMQEAP